MGNVQTACLMALAVALAGCQSTPSSFQKAARAGACTDPVPTKAQIDAASAQMLSLWARQAAISKDIYIMGDNSCREWALNYEVLAFSASSKARTTAHQSEIDGLNRQISVGQSILQSR